MYKNVKLNFIFQEKTINTVSMISLKQIQTNKSVTTIYNIIKRNFEENNQLILD